MEQFKQILTAIAKLEATVNKQFEEQNVRISALELKMDDLIGKNIGRNV